MKYLEYITLLIFSLFFNYPNYSVQPIQNHGNMAAILRLYPIGKKKGLTVPQKLIQMRWVDQNSNQDKDSKRPTLSNNEENQYFNEKTANVSMTVTFLNA